MSDVSGDGDATATYPSLTVSASYKESGGGKSSSKRRPIRPSFEAAADNELITMLHGSDPVKVELNRLENEVRDKDRELGEAHAEIRALRLSERQREKAVEELTEELAKLDEKLNLTESILQSKNLEIKKINEEKKASMAAQFAAEATLRRVHAAQKDGDMPPIEAILAPLEAELKLARSEEENKILDKMHRQKVAEVEKLTQTVRELEEAVLAGGATANTVRDYQRKVQEINEERKTLDRELARAKVTANRVATVVANEWKDGNDKVMPVKQWLEERRFLQGEMQQLCDKLAITDRAAKSEAQLKEKFQQRLKVLEETLKGTSSSSSTTTRNLSETRSMSNGPSRRQSLGGSDNLQRLPSNGSFSKKAPSFQMRHSLSINSTSVLKNGKGTSKSFDGGTRSLDRGKALLNGPGNYSFNKASSDDSKDTEEKAQREDHAAAAAAAATEDSVPGVLYDLLQKEVVSLRKASHEKDQSLKDKDDAIEMLARKVETLTKAMEVEAKKMRRELAAMEKEVAAMRVEKDQDNRAKRFSNSKSSSNTAQILAARAAGRSSLTKSTQ
ncbi:microtubule-associated protein 70-2 isoform X2 [Brassica rapa]|uniref:microtubule-associated protein 70-2 isoform X2 n=1 Tax=Brassica campestris TaxID=3711 RepID=UPI00142D88E6|nr:microtubule-associated protein 70-2 isoform X2 [Brassica rapa]